MKTGNRFAFGMRRFIPLQQFLMVMTVLWALTASAQAPPGQSRGPADGASASQAAEYVISPDDVLNIYVLDEIGRAHV